MGFDFGVLVDYCVYGVFDFGDFIGVECFVVVEIELQMIGCVQ